MAKMKFLFLQFKDYRFLTVATLLGLMLSIVPVFLAGVFPAIRDNNNQLLSLWRSPLFAHTVKVSHDVAVTFHIEPNHNPRVGIPALTWFLLTRQGGITIPYRQCNCNLEVYSLPRTTSAQPILRPRLYGLNVEGYGGVPAARIIFPRVGRYDIVISGSARPPSTFQNFSISYPVLVTGRG